MRLSSQPLSIGAINVTTPATSEALKYLIDLEMSKYRAALLKNAAAVHPHKGYGFGYSARPDIFDENELEYTGPINDDETITDEGLVDCLSTLIGPFRDSLSNANLKPIIFGVSFIYQTSLSSKSGNDMWHCDSNRFAFCVLTPGTRQFECAVGTIDIPESEIENTALNYRRQEIMDTTTKTAISLGNAENRVVPYGTIVCCDTDSVHRRGQFQNEGWRVILRAEIRK